MPCSSWQKTRATYLRPLIQRSDVKVRDVRALLDRAKNPAPIEIAGGVDRYNAARVVAAGSQILVAGSAIFHAKDPEQATRDLRSAAEQGLASQTLHV